MCRSRPEEQCILTWRISFASLESHPAQKRESLASQNFAPLVLHLDQAPVTWKGTPAEAAFNLDGLLQTTVIFTGPAGEAAQRYPKNANLAATVALAGAGFDKTEVQLIADPAAKVNRSRIEAEGALGELRVEMRGAPMPDNPKTSAVTAYSILHAIRNRDSVIVI